MMILDLRIAGFPVEVVKGVNSPEENAEYEPEIFGLMAE